MNRILLLLAGLLVLHTPAQAKEQYQDVWRYRAESAVMVDALSNDFGVWGGLDCKFYYRHSRSVTLFANPMIFDRAGSFSVLGGVGAYVDWLPILYTYTSLYSGTRDEGLYNPLIRLDHDFNLKMGKQANIIGTFGFTFIDQHNDHWDVAPYAGMSAYLGKFVLAYRIVFNISNPGALLGLNHVASADYGEDGKHSSFLAVSYGKSAYLGTYMVDPYAIRQNAFSASVGHRHWISNNWGLFGSVSFLYWERSYEKYGALVGAFFTWGHLAWD